MTNEEREIVDEVMEELKKSPDYVEGLISLDGIYFNMEGDK